MEDSLFSTEQQFKASFSQGLLDLIADSPSSGTFILAFANFLQQPSLYQQHYSSINRAYSKLLPGYQQNDTLNIMPNEPADDVDVMSSIIAMGLENIQSNKSRIIRHDKSQWLINFNQLRSLRPERLSKENSSDINMAFNPDGFHFDKDFLSKEIFIENTYKDRTISMLYNKFPFSDYHCLMVVDKHKHHNQFLFSEMFDYVWLFYQRLSRIIPQLVLAYNSLSAGASVNHLHFQTAVPGQHLSITCAHWKHNGGEHDYPAECIVFNQPDEAWALLTKLQTDNVAFNFIFVNGLIYCLPRELSVTMPADIKQVGWYEMAGCYSVADSRIFEQLDYSQIKATLEAVSRG